MVIELQLRERVGDHPNLRRDTLIERASAGIPVVGGMVGRMMQQLDRGRYITTNCEDTARLYGLCYEPNLPVPKSHAGRSYG